MINIDKYKKLKDELSTNNVNLIAISKRQPIEKIIELYNAGHKDFGENRIEGLQERVDNLKDKDINWHFVGHLQRNKVKHITKQVSMIHSVDSLRLLNKINTEAEKQDRIIDCLLQMYIAKEEAKFGLDEKELKQLINSEDFHSLKNVRICGLMGMATNTDDTDIVKKEFKYLRNVFDNFKESYFLNHDYFKEVSMGMSNDYKIAIDEGSTMVRIGTMIFGERD